MALPTIHRSKNEAAAPANRASSRRSRKRLLVAFAVLLVLGTVVAAYVWAGRVTQQQLAQAIGEADRLDPVWMLEELEKQQPLIPGEEDALCVLRDAYAVRPLGSQWPGPELQEILQNHSPEKQFDGRQRGLLRADVERGTAVARAARKLEAFQPDVFRFRATLQEENPYSSLLHGQLYVLVQALAFDAKLRAQEGDPVGALASLRYALHLSSLANPMSNFAGAQGRASRRRLILLELEETLAQTEPPEDVLAEMQRLLEREEPIPLLRNALRGDRAYMHWLFTRIELGDTTISRNPLAYLWSYQDPDQELPPVAAAYDRLGQPMVRQVHAVTLQYLTEMVQAAKLPRAQQQAAFANVHFPESVIPHFFLQNLPYLYSRAAASFQYHDAHLRCTIAALAAERYRLRNGTWPPSLAEIAPDPPTDAWTDPADGEPLRYAVLEDGIVIYSLGPTGVDNKGKIDRRNAYAGGTNWGIRLWNPDRRRQPANAIGPIPGPAKGP